MLSCNRHRRLHHQISRSRTPCLRQRCHCQRRLPRQRRPHQQPQFHRILPPRIRPVTSCLRHLPPFLRLHLRLRLRPWVLACASLGQF